MKRRLPKYGQRAGKADFIASDFRDAASASALAKKAVGLGNGHVDILINNAGVFPFGPTHETSVQLHAPSTTPTSTEKLRSAIDRIRGRLPKPDGSDDPELPSQPN